MNKVAPSINSMQNIQPGTPGEWYQFALERRADGILIGDVALKVNDTEKSEAELGFTLAPEPQNRLTAIPVSLVLGRYRKPQFRLALFSVVHL